ncbi:UNVERIFIED_CONTAM: hypothetical protein FKN15_021711 [Acipenser sinensis]
MPLRWLDRHSCISFPPVLWYLGARSVFGTSVSRCARRHRDAGVRHTCTVTQTVPILTAPLDDLRHRLQASMTANSWA